MASDIITRNVDNYNIAQRRRDGYVNLTAMAKASGKRINNYLRNRTTKDFIAELSAVTRISATELVQVIRGGIPEEQGTWGHPLVATHCGQWCSAKFAVLVSQWVFEWMTTGQNPLQQAEPQQPQKLPATMPTEKQMEYLRSRPWEKAELEGMPIDWDEVAKESGFDQALEAVRDNRKFKKLRGQKRLK